MLLKLRDKLADVVVVVTKAKAEHLKSPSATVHNKSDAPGIVIFQQI